VTAHEYAYYNEVWPSGGQFTPEDFQRLDEDPAWNLIYESGDMMIWKRNAEE
jgi:hypothetical protein